MLFFGDELAFSEHPLEVFCRKAALKNFVNFMGKHLCWSLFLIKLQEHLRATVSTFLHFTEREWLLNEIILSFSVSHSEMFRLILIFFWFFLSM